MIYSFYQNISMRKPHVFITWGLNLSITRKQMKHRKLAYHRFVVFNNTGICLFLNNNLY